MQCLRSPLSQLGNGDLLFCIEYYTELFCLCHFQGDEEEEETDNLVNQVLDEIGINLDEQMVAAPGQKVQVCDHISLSIFNPLVACRPACRTHTGPWEFSNPQ